MAACISRALTPALLVSRDSAPIVTSSCVVDPAGLMASSRTSTALLCICVVALLLVADVAAAAPAERLPHQQSQVTGSTKQFYLRGEVVSMLAENETVAVEESLEFFERRELSDYGTTSSKPNCSGHCK